MPRGHERLFISYRRAETGTIGGRIYDRLSASLGADRIYMDIYANKPGEEFNVRIREALETARVFLPLVGLKWEEPLPGAERARLWDPADVVRQEIELALANNLGIVPVLIDRENVPEPETLPDVVRPIFGKQALILRSDHRFHSSLNELARAVDRLVFRQRQEISCVLIPLEGDRDTERLRRLVPDRVLVDSGISNVTRLRASRPELTGRMLQADLLVLLGSVLPAEIAFVLGRRLAHGKKPALLLHLYGKPVPFDAGARCIACRLSDPEQARAEMAFALNDLF